MDNWQNSKRLEENKSSHVKKAEGTENCRPVRLIPVLCKVFEQIKEHVNKHLDSNAEMNNTQ